MGTDVNNGSQGEGLQTAAELRTIAWRRLPTRIFAFLVSADFFFLAAFALLIALGRTHTRVFALVDLNLETNPPSWYASFQLLAVALPFLVLGSKLLPIQRRAAQARRLWLVLGLGFAYLSIDEGAALHERLGPILTKIRFNIGMHSGGQWAFFYLLLAAVLLVFVRKDLVLAWRDWRPELLLFAFGFAVLAAGEIGLEMLQFAYKWQGIAKFVEIGLEEGLGMLGVSIMVLSAFRVLSRSVTWLPDSEAVPRA